MGCLVVEERIWAGPRSEMCRKIFLALPCSCAYFNALGPADCSDQNQSSYFHLPFLRSDPPNNNKNRQMHNICEELSPCPFFFSNSFLFLLFHTL